MFRRCLIDASPTIRGRPWKVHDNPIAIHQSAKGPEKKKIDFSVLKYPGTRKSDRKDGPYPTLKYNNITTATSMYRLSVQNLSISTDELPFSIERTMHSTLPVYTDVRGGKTKVITVLCKCSGDIDILKEEMGKVCDGKEITVRAGKLLVDGNYVKRLKIWMTGLGL